jgi:GntR family transcriptional regulator
MRFWFVHSGEVSLREQIVTQVALGIASGELQPGERLPSTRELARRFRLHPNTVSAAYRSLERDGRVEMRRGSGVFVRAAKASGESAVHGADEAVADGVIVELFAQARERGVTDAVLRGRLVRWLAAAPPNHLLLVEPDEELRRIVVAEIAQAVTAPVRGCSMEELFVNGEDKDNAIVMALPSKATLVRESVAVGVQMVTLQVRSVPGSLAAWLPAPPGTLVGIASRWPEFLTHARTMLIAAGMDADSLMLRDAREKDWLRGLEQATAVVCDLVTAELVGEKVRVIPFRVLAESSIAELQHLAMTMEPKLGLL